MNNEIRYLKLIYLLFLTGLTVVFFSSWYYNLARLKKTSLEYAKTEAFASYNKDLLYRRWASAHGGVYVPITTITPPNPNLLFITDRDITSEKGKKYTLVNPAYMTRQVHELAQSQYGVKGHITSLLPIRAENKPDQWEENALKQFEKEKKEVYSIETMDSAEFLRYMQPMLTEKTCLKCHAHQGYKLGDIRGGISVSVPMAPYHEVLKSEMKILTLTHFIIYFIIISLSFPAYFKLLKEMVYRSNIQSKLLENEIILQQQNNEYQRLNSEYKKQNTELLKAKIRAEESNQLKTAFIQNISHEIRTPMNSIIGFSELIDDPTLPIEKRHRFINIVISSTKQLLSIVNNILTISALDKNQEMMNYEPVCINGLIEDLWIVFRQKAIAQGTELKKYIPLTDIEAEIITDKTKLTQILTNLISNSIKFTKNGIVAFGYTLKNDNLEFFVKDNGIGIKKEFHEIIFERFRQADTSIGKKYGGNGLGLSISKGFVEMLGGKIWVDSEPGKGSVFAFTIPYKKPDNLKIS